MEGIDEHRVRTQGLCWPTPDLAGSTAKGTREGTMLMSSPSLSRHRPPATPQSIYSPEYLQDFVANLIKYQKPGKWGKSMTVPCAVAGWLLTNGAFGKHATAQTAEES